MFARILTLLIAFFTFSFSLSILPTPAFAQSQDSVATSSPALNIRYNIPTNISATSPLYTDMLLHNMFHTFSCLAVGSSVIGQPCLTYQVTKNAQGSVQSIPVLSQVDLSGGALGATSSLIGALYSNPPIRTADYLASVGQGLGVVKTANAQVTGSGAAVLQPILALWQVSRNIAYLIMIIIFIVIGLMVMFRNRINPQTVITAQAALPGLVIGLILITFSYFLAGLIADTAFLGTNLVGSYFSAVKGKPDEGQNLAELISHDSVVSIFSKFVGIARKEDITSALDSIWDHLDGSVTAWLRVIAGAIAFQYTFQTASIAQLIPGIGAGIQAGLATLGAASAAAVPTQVIGLALSFVAMLILLYSMFRLLLRLINSFLTIIFLTISAPFQFLFASLPGRQSIATGWILSMLGNVLVFPAVLGVFYFVAFILGQDFGPLKVTDLQQIKDGVLVPTVYAQGQINIVDSATFPLLGGLDLGFVKILVAFGALVALPTIPDLIIKAVGQASQAGQMIGQQISSGIGSGQRYSGQFQQGMGAIGERGGGIWDQPGYRPYQDPNTGKWNWEKVNVKTAGTPEKAYQAGLRPGGGAKLGAGWNTFKGYFRK